MDTKKFTATEVRTIGEIVNRVAAMENSRGLTCDRLSVRMDISSVHETLGLRLEDLLEADDFNFTHDVFGIRKHLDRSEYPGKLMDFFRPRFAKLELK